MNLPSFFPSGVQVPGGILLVQHGEDDLRGDPPRLFSHIQVQGCLSFEDSGLDLDLNYQNDRGFLLS